jgi:redox-sensitive bicupin YhaK (pirin superfamily)
VTYLIEGELEHRDSLGNGGLLRAGDTQWMTAGAGIIHKEGPSAAFQETGGRSHGFQLWVNLPAALKMTAPRYQDIRGDAVAVAELEGGGRARVIAGSLFGVQGPGSTLTPISYAHVSMAAGTSAATEVPAAHNVGVLVFGGSAEVGGTAAADGDFVVLGAGTLLTIHATSDAELMVLVGQPLHEPVARYGPFVMNTRAELAQAFEDYRSGRMGSIAAVTV